MMQATERALRDKGVDAARIKTELFGTMLDDGRVRVPRVQVDGTGQCTVEVVLDGTRRSFVMDKNKDNLVDAGIKAGLEMPYSCKGGVCSTCRALVVQGEVDMDINFALEDYEVARGFVLCCQSYPVTDQLTIDFDREHAHS
jgi:ring-1,2-phenylacetyl-CoA epoxidase subunit PaaE